MLPVNIKLRYHRLSLRKIDRLFNFLKKLFLIVGEELLKFLLKYYKLFSVR